MYGLEEERVFQWTKKELQTKIDLGEGERIPTLEALIQLCQYSPNMLLNIELKGPLDESWEAHYDYDDAASKVVSLIEKYDIASKTMISSFVPRILDSIAKAAPHSARKPRKFVIQSLRNRGGIEDPWKYVTDPGHTGVNMLYTRMTKQIV